MKEHGLAPEECAFVGDGKNDVALARVVGVSVAFNGDPELREVSTHSVEQARGKEDFSEILRFF